MFSPSTVLNKADLLDFSDLDGEMIMTLSVYEIQCPLQPSPSTSTSLSAENNSQCFGCNKPINDKYLINAMDHLWHESCLKCSYCNCNLAAVGSTLFTRSNLILCKKDYLRLFGKTGRCAGCNERIEAFELILRAKHNVYHLSCFECQLCKRRLKSGDRYILFKNRLFCERDYKLNACRL